MPNGSASALLPGDKQSGDNARNSMRAMLQLSPRPRCYDTTLAYNDAPAQQEQLQQVASSDAQPLAAAAVASSDAQPLAAMTT
mgnify:CR=1 FL=1